MTLLEGILLIVIGLLVAIISFIYRRGVAYGKAEREAWWQSNLPRMRSEIAERQRVGIKGRVSETFAPFLEGFPFKASECKFLGDPIDYVVFEGLDERNIKGVHFVEVKSGGSKLSPHQKQIKDAIDSLGDSRVTFRTFEFKDV